MGLTTVHIAFGGNLGEVRDTFIQARYALNQNDAINVLKSSKLYRTPPLGPPGQPDYLNAVIAIETALEPLQLLDLLQHIEVQHGRERGERWGPRTLDLDIIDFDNRIVNTDRLTLPHPHLHERMFVLCPLCDIALSWQHPLLQASAQQLMKQLLEQGETPLPPGERW